MVSDNPKVSIVVTCLNAEENIADCIGSLLAQDYDNLEIILVDAGSSDHTVRVAQRAANQHVNFRLIVDETALTPARGRNIGAKFATGGLLAFTDSDCVAAPSWISTLLRPENWGEDTGGVGGKTLFTVVPEHRRMLRALHGVIRTRFGSGGSAQFFDKDSRVKVRSLPSCNVVYRMEVFVKHSGFDEALRYCEDSCLNAKIRRSGLNLLYIPEAVVLHRHRCSVREFARWIYDYGRGRASALRKDVRALSANVAVLAVTAVLLAALALQQFFPYTFLFLSALGLYSSVALVSAVLSSGRGIRSKMLYFVGYFLIHSAYAVGLVVGLARPWRSRSSSGLGSYSTG